MAARAGATMPAPMCGFIGVIGSSAAVHEIYDGLVTIQHRGQDAAGIITYDGDRFHVKKGEGWSATSSRPPTWSACAGDIGVGHVRYPTVGSGGGEDAQPFTVNYPFGIVMAHNGNVANYDALRGELAEEGCGTSIRPATSRWCLNVFAKALADRSRDGFEPRRLPRRGGRVLSPRARRLQRRRLHRRARDVRLPRPVRDQADRDRPQATPDDGGSHAVVSESVVLTTIGYERLETGSSPARRCSSTSRATSNRHQVAPAESSSLRVRVRLLRAARLDHRRTLRSTGAVQHGRSGWRGRSPALDLDRDVVVPVPDSARTAALAMAQELGIPYREALVKNRYVGRTFIMPDEGERRRSVRQQAQHDRRGVPRQARPARRRLDRARQYQPADRPDGSSGRRRQGVLRLDLASARAPLRVRDRHEHPA